MPILDPSGGEDSSNDHYSQEDSPLYFKDAYRDIGISERTHSGASNPAVERYIYDVLGHTEDARSTPWCAFFVGSKLKGAGYPHSGSGMARSYLKYADRVPNNEFQQGDIVILWRGRQNDNVTGHIGFLVRWDEEYIWLLGGNQGDKVSIQKFSRAKILSVRRPRSVTKSRTLRSAAAALTSEVSSKATDLLPEPSKVIDALEQTKGPLEVLAGWKPEIKFLLSGLTIALIFAAMYYRTKDYKEGKNT